VGAKQKKITDKGKKEGVVTLQKEEGSWIGYQNVKKKEP